jgi:hypothetical protein
MKENLLHFIWKLQLFSSNNLFCTNGNLIKVVSAGIQNENAGPDFLNAKVFINEQLWVGNIEIHLNSSDWYAHHHEVDTSYDSVILHVVWEHNVEVFRANNTPITTLALKNFIATDVLNNYQQLFNKNEKWINCENLLTSVNEFKLSHWFERLYVERLEQKSIQIKALQKSTNNNWEEILFKLLAKNFGLKINADAFFNMVNTFDFSIVRKVFGNQLQLEALFFGQAGLLSKSYESAYYNSLKKEYVYLQAKFNIVPILNSQVHFFRLRPQNFPTIRLSQFAMLYYLNQQLFSKIIVIKNVEEFYKLFALSTSIFWETHFTFETTSKKNTKKLTKPFIDLLLINTIIPIQFMYFKSIGKDDFSDLLTIMEQLKPEKNTIISKFDNLGIKAHNAFETQSLLQLKNEYCSLKRCLNCEVGKELLSEKNITNL